MGGPQTLKLGDGFTTRDNKNWNVTCYTGHRPWTIILKGNLKRNRMGTGRIGFIWLSTETSGPALVINFRIP
jgi:hypothetical protein